MTRPRGSLGAAAILNLCVATLVGCSGGGVSVGAPEGRSIISVTWLSDGWIYLLRQADPAGSSTYADLWRVRADGKGMEKTAEPSITGCRLTRFDDLQRLPDGRLGFARRCLDASGQGASQTELIAYDVKSREVERLAEIPEVNQYTWRADLQNGYVSRHYRDCEGIAPLTRQGIQRFPTPTTLDSRSWRLDDVFIRPPDAECTDAGRARDPVLTSNGDGLLFLASPDSVGQPGGHGGEERHNLPWNLYLLPASGSEPRTIDRGYVLPDGMSLSPNSAVVAITGKHSDQAGLWMVSIATGRRNQLASGSYAHPRFSPDGRKVVVAHSTDRYNDELRIVAVSGS